LVDEAAGIGVLDHEQGASRYHTQQAAKKLAKKLEQQHANGKVGKNNKRQKMRKSSSSSSGSGDPVRSGRAGASLSYLTIRAAPMVHPIPCVGFVVEESPRPGRLNDKVVLPLIAKHKQSLIGLGYKVPEKLAAAFKMMKSEESFEFPDGQVLFGRDAVSPPRKGRKVK
jgi:hypothetical protein